MPNGLNTAAGSDVAVPPDPPFASPDHPGPKLQPPLEPGDLGSLGQYRVVEVIGRGGMGVVYLGIDTQIRRKIALKTMLPKYSSSRSARERFLKEARAAGALHHDNVVVIYQVGEAAGVPFIAMEYLSGASLERQIRADAVMPLPQVVRVLREVAAGLACAHETGVIHRDVKPENIWLEAPSGRVKLLDFGLARIPEGSGAQSGTVGLVGTPAYMSPEQARGTGLDHRSDLFSLGAVAYELATGRQPFPGANMFDTLAAVMGRNPVPPRQVKPYIPASLDTLILRLLAKDPDARPQSAAEVEAALGRIAAELQPAANPEPAVVYLPYAVNVVSDPATGHELPAFDAARFAYPPPQPPMATPAPPMPTPGPRPPISTLAPVVTPVPVPVSLSPPADPGPAPARAAGGSTWSGLADAAAEHPPWANPAAPPAPRSKWKLLVPAAVGGLAVVVLAAVAVVSVFGPATTTAPTSATATAPPTSKPAPRGPRFAPLDPAFVEKVRGLPVPEQAKAVAEEIRKRNIKFAGTIEYPPADAKLYRLWLCTDYVTDLTPLRALPHLTHLRVYGTNAGGSLGDLSPLAGLPLVHLEILNNPVADLSPLAGLPLEHLDLRETSVKSLADLKSLKSLKHLNLGNCRWIGSIDPLRGLPLRELDLTHTVVDNLGPLADAPLEALRVGPKAVDLGPVAKCPLVSVAADPVPAHDSPLRASSVKFVNGLPADTFWRRADIRRDVHPTVPFALWNTHRPEVLAWGPDGDILAAAVPDGIHARTVGVGLTPSKLGNLDARQGDYRWAAPTGDRVAILFRSSKIRFFDPKSDAEKGDPLDLPKIPDVIAASRDGRILATGFADGTARVHSLTVKKEPVEIRDLPRPVRALAASRDGTRLAIAAGHAVKVWDVAAEKIVASFELHALDHGTTLEFDPPGKRLLARTMHGTAVVWKLDGGDKPHDPEFTLAGAGLAAARFTPDAAGVVVGWHDGWVGVYPIGKPGPLVEFPAHDEPVRVLAFAPDGKALATGHENQTRLWAWPAVTVPPAAAKPADPPPGFTRLFNGTDLTGWKTRDWEPKDLFAVRNGVIAGAAAHDRGGWLESEAEFGDFDLRFEYRWLTPGGDSGVAVRVPRLVGWPTAEGVELNLADDANAEALVGHPPADHERTGAVGFFAKPTDRAPRRLGEWNAVRVIAKGRQLTLEHNGKVIQAADLAKLDATIKDKDRDAAKGLKRDKGVIALQAGRGRVEFRNVFAKELPPDPPKKP